MALGLGPGGAVLLSATSASRRPKRGHTELEAESAAAAGPAPSAIVRRSSRTRHRVAGLAGFDDTWTQSETSSMLAAAAPASGQLAAQSLAAPEHPLDEIASGLVASAVPTPWPEPPGIAKPAPALDQEAAALQKRMAEGLFCGVCRRDIKAADARLECMSHVPAAEL